MLHDAHVHFFSHRYYQLLARQASRSAAEVAALAGHQLPPEDPVDLARQWLAQFDAQGVDRAVLIASVVDEEESVAAAVRQFPHRLSGYFFFDPTAPDATLRLERGLAEFGLTGVCLFPAMHHYYPDDERLLPLYDLLQAARAVVFVHCGLLRIPIREQLGLPRVFDMRYGHPIRLQRVANLFPDLPFVIPHFGAGYLRDTMMLGAAADNVYVDTSSSNGWMDLYPGLTLRAVFETALKVYGPDRLLFGTDSSTFPRGWRDDVHEAQRRVLVDIGVGEETRAKVFGGNLARLLDRVRT
jgi:predicted TIM-barrel fold metal-dependent hydrolase